MHRLVSPFILEKYAVGETSGDLTVASLFVDISGFSTITDTLMTHGQHGAEVMAALMRQIFDPLVEAVYAHDGFITTFAGDAFTALFPTREAGEGDWRQAAQRALVAGWTIRHTVAEHPPYKTIYANFEVGVKVGLATGDAHWGIIQAEENEQAIFYFRGTAIDRAAHAEQQASRNMMILTATAHKLLQDQTTTVAHNGYHQLLAVGHHLPAPQPIGLPPLDEKIMRAFFPPNSLRQIHTDEFRHIVNLFISVDGALSGNQITEFGQILLKLQTDYGGLFNHIDFGDKGCNVIIFFGAPIAHENDVNRALNFALALQAQSPISIRAGVTWRIAHAGTVGSPLHGDFTCTGNGVNLAARFMMTAPLGQIWLDAPIATKGQETFEISQVGAQQVKGFAQPQTVYRLGSQKSFATRFYKHEMVGREAEIEEVQTFIEQILDPTAKKRFSGILTVIGDAGLGKSRLVTKVRVALEESGGVQFALGQTNQLHRSSFNPFTYWLRNYFDQKTNQSISANQHAFQQKLEQLVAVTTNEELSKTLTQGLSALGSLIDLRWENSAYEQLPPEGRYEWRLSALKALLLAESLQTPLVIVLEDIHWLDSQSIAFIERLVRGIDEYPIAILATARPTTDSKPLLGQVDYRELHLSLLKREVMAELLPQVLAAPLTDGVLDIIVGRAEGNPFFGEQIGLYLQDQGIIKQQDGVWHLAKQDGEYYLPQDIRIIFTARLDQLTTKLKEIVQTASILGREFEVQVLSGMLSGVAELPAHIQTLENESIWTALNQIRYLFKHTLLRDAAYAMQVRSQRSQLHQLAATTLEQLYAPDLAPHYEKIAKHYLTAYNQGLSKVGRKAIHYLQVTAQQLSINNEHQRVITTVAQAVAIIDDGVMGTETIKSRYELLLLQEASCDFLGQRETQKVVLQQLLDVAQTKPTWQLEIYLRQIEMAGMIGAYEVGLEQAEVALALAQQLDDVGREAALAVILGNIAKQQSRHKEAIRWGERGVKLAEIGGRLDVLAKGVNLLGNITRAQGRYEEAVAYYTRSLAIDEEIGNKRGVSMSLNNLGLVADELGRYEEAVAYYTRSLAIREEIGDRRGVSMSLNNMGVVARTQGQYKKAMAYYSRSLAIDEEIGSKRGVSISLNNLGVVAHHQGRREEAVTYHTRSLAIRKELGNRFGVAMSLFNLGIIIDEQERYDESIIYFAQALTMCEEIGDKHLKSYVLTGLGKANISLGQFDNGIVFLKQAIDLRQQLGKEILMESLAVLGWGYLEAGNLSKALAVMEEVESYLAEGGRLTGTEYKWCNAWYCYQVLAAGGDERAAGRLAATYEGVMAAAAKIEDEVGRQRFLEDVPWHREIVAAYEERAGRVGCR
ncbi:MAG TPA: tetratricopeptide repeat protein [Anaerolineae bacterium]|nr:tetratricopeptide repeat protein [Anaerolineae bacterium]